MRFTKEAIEGMIGTYADASIGTGKEDFLEERWIMEKKFDSSPRDYEYVTFSGIQIYKEEEGGYIMHQTRYMKNIEHLPSTCTFEDFRSLRHKLVFLCHIRPDICALINILAQVTLNKVEGGHIKALNKVVQGLDAKECADCDNIN